jgi:hypothetical protein
MTTTTTSGAWVATVVATVRDSFVAACGGSAEAALVLDVALLVVLAVGIAYAVRLTCQQWTDVSAAFWTFVGIAGVRALKMVAAALAVYVLASQALASYARITGGARATPLEATSAVVAHARASSAAVLNATTSAATSTEWTGVRLAWAYAANAWGALVNATSAAGTAATTVGAAPGGE